MTDFELLTVADVQLMQGLAQRVTATHLELVNADTTYGELAWIWGKGHAAHGKTWLRRLWFADGGLVAWGWAQLPHAVRRSNGVVKQVTGANLVYQVHPGHAVLVDEVITWYDAVAADLERTVVPTAADTYALQRWAVHGYEADDSGEWTQLNQRALTELEEPQLPAGYRFTTAAETGPEAAVQAHLDAWNPSTYSPEAHEGVRRTPGYRPDLHVLIAAPDGTMAASTVLWLDGENRTAEFEPVGTHPAHRRKGLGKALIQQGLHLAKAAGATHATVACEGSPDHPAAKNLYYSVGFREVSRDAPLVRASRSARGAG